LILIVIVIYLFLTAKIKNEEQKSAELVKKVMESNQGEPQGSYVWNKREVQGKTANGKAIKVTVTLKEQPFEKAIHGRYWGVYENDKLITLIDSFEVVIGKETISIPVSAYADLAHIGGNVYLGILKDEYKIRIPGGGDASGYQAIFTIKNNHLINREIYLGEFSNKVYKTVFN
jgi:hypothetical protein